MYTQLQRKTLSPDAVSPGAASVRAPRPAIPNSALHTALGIGGDRSMDDLQERILQRQPAIRLQNQIPQAENEADRLSATVHSGSPESVKAAMGRRLGADFSGVRFHTDNAAAEQAGAMGARAFTSGADVYFGAGGFDPSVAAHELVHTVQQGMAASETATLSTPAGGVQMKPLTKLDIKKMKFGKGAYKKDADYQSMKKLMKAFNKSGGSPETRSALMESAMQYIDKYSTGAEAKHKGRTAKAEDILFQLSMDNGQQAAAMGNLDRFQSDIQNQANPENNPIVEKAKANMLPALGTMKDMVSGGQNFSKALQMTTAGVISQLNNATLQAGGASTTKRELGSRQYAMSGRGTIDQNDTIGTTLHEMTHAASGNIYENTTALFTAGSSDSVEALRSRRDDNTRRMDEILAASRGGPQGQMTDSAASSVAGLSSWVEERQGYATGGKMLGQYIPGEKKKMMRRVKASQGFDMRTANNKQLTDLLPQYGETMQNIDAEQGLSKEEIADMKNNASGFQKMEEAMSDVAPNPAAAQPSGRVNTDALIEYDPVINQVFSQYEAATDDRGSEFYRKLKAAVLRSHVNRQKELLAKQMAPRKTSEETMSYRAAAVPENYDPATATEDQSLAMLYHLIKNPRPGDDEETISARRRQFAQMRADQMRRQEREKRR